MFYAIDPKNGVPIYEQIVRQMNFAIASEALRAGDMVPSVRELARELAVNPNTVARAYRQLQSDGVLEAVRGTGLAVASGSAQRCRDARIRIISERIDQVLEVARQSRLAVTEIRRLVEEAVAKIAV